MKRTCEASNLNIAHLSSSLDVNSTTLIAHLVLNKGKNVLQLTYSLGADALRALVTGLGRGLEGELKIVSFFEVTIVFPGEAFLCFMVSGTLANAKSLDFRNIGALIKNKSYEIKFKIEIESMTTHTSRSLLIVSSL